MGIKYLHRILKPITKSEDIARFKGKTAAIDILTWLYKGAFSCAYELGIGQRTLDFLQFPIKMLKLLQLHNIKPIYVFDGLRKPSKADTEKTRTDTKQRTRRSPRRSP